MPNNVTSNTNDLWADNKEYIILFTGIVALYIATNKLVEIYILENIVDYILRYIPAEKWYNDILFIFSIILITIMTYNNRSKLYYLNRTYIYLYAATVVYLINRFSSNWEFHSTSLLNYLYYSDILIFASIATIILLIKTQLNNPEQTDLFQNENGLGFITDRPIINIEDDKLQYSNYADNIAKRILDTNAYNSFAIGINGKWGTGKTSFFNLIKKKLSEQNKDYIEIDFSPWNTENPKAMMTDFFETFEEELSKYHSNVSKTVSNYSKKLTSLNEIDTIKPFTSVFSSFFSNPTTLVEFKCDLEKTIRSINKKIIVYIDDLDRLDNSEIIEVLRLIRNTANFKNTFFIVAYDKNYVSNALTAYNSYNKEGFLEKIFQLEINLPYYDKEQLINQLNSNLILTFPDKKNLFDYHLFRKNSIVIDVLFENINTMRDIVLLSNSLIINYENLKGNVDFKDLICLEVLRLKFSKIYEILKNKNKQFLNLNTSKKNLYTLVTSEKNEENHLYNLIQNDTLQLDINILNINKIKLILSELFNMETVNFLSLVNPSKYENYFSYRLLDKTLDENEFILAMEKSFDLAKTDFTIWINRGYESDLLTRLYSYNTFDNFDKYKKIIKLIFYLGNHKSNFSNNIIGFDYTDLLQNKFTSTKWNNIDEHKKFIMDTFSDGDLPLAFESGLLYNIRNHDYSDIVKNRKYLLTFHDMEDISISLLNIYSQQKDKIDKSLIEIIKSNAQHDHYIQFSYSYGERFKSKILEYFDLQSIDDVITFIINSQTPNLYSINHLVFAIFKNSNGLIQYLRTRSDRNNSEYYNDAISFIKTYRNNTGAIEFEFSKALT